MTVGAIATEPLPMRVTARLRGPLTGAPMLDALLAAVEAQRAGLVTGFGPIVPIEIPVAREPSGRFHLASGPLANYDAHELRYLNRKFPLAEAQALAGPKLRRIVISAGPCKSYRIPGDVQFATGDEIEWIALGDLDRVRDLLSHVTHLGKKRSVGRGPVVSWDVEPCEAWRGFPVVQDGRPLRPLPVDWPGLVEPATAYHTLTYPYWEHSREELCAVPQ